MVWKFGGVVWKFGVWFGGLGRDLVSFAVFFGEFWGVVWWVLGCGLVGFGVWFGGF